MEIIIRKDGEWYIAEVKSKPNIYAFWYSKEEALSELKNVVDMMVDYHLQEISFQKKVKKFLINKSYTYAV
jgi:predicted RNase H-like HicB family nuclease